MKLSVTEKEELEVLKKRLDVAEAMSGEGTIPRNSSPSVDWPLVRMEPAYRTALPDFERLLGPSHPDVLRICDSLARCLQEQRRFREAIPLAKRAYEGRRKIYGLFNDATNQSRRLVNDLEWDLKASSDAIDYRTAPLNAVCEVISDAAIDVTTIVFRNALIIFPIVIAFGLGLWWVSKKR